MGILRITKARYNAKTETSEVKASFNNKTLTFYIKRINGEFLPQLRCELLSDGASDNINSKEETPKYAVFNDAIINAAETAWQNHKLKNLKVD